MLRSLRGRGGTADRWSSSSGGIGLWSAESSRRDGSITSGRRRSLVWSFSTGIAGIFSFFLILVGVRAFSIICIILLLRLTDVPDEDLDVGVVHTG
jgi:hypothetical protein